MLQGTQAPELTLHHDGQAAAQSLTLLHAGTEKGGETMWKGGERELERESGRVRGEKTTTKGKSVESLMVVAKSYLSLLKFLPYPDLNPSNLTIYLGCTYIHIATIPIVNIYFLYLFCFFVFTQIHPPWDE